MELPDVLRRSMRKSAFEKTPYDFLPQGALDSIITEATILTAMGIKEPTPEDFELATYILTKAKRVFATAAYITFEPETLHKAMVLFHDANFEDGRLPLEDLSGLELLGSDISAWEHPLLKLEGPTRYESMRIWTFRRVHAFVEVQFKFLAPIISIGDSDASFGNLILPFVTKGTAQAEGSFGVVSKYKIHSDHIQNPAGQNIEPSNTVAIKTFKMNHGGDHQDMARRWASEVKAMSMVNKLKQDHIVRFITAFQGGTSEVKEYYLVTEWADGGNLRDFWKAIPNPSLTTSLVKAVIQQLRGLSEALCAIHAPRIDGVDVNAGWRHGDLKPENILWFRSPTDIGTLKIGDWGEAKGHQDVTAMRHDNTTARYGTRRYEPPESEIGAGTAHLDQKDMRRSRLYDIWSFGCITLEFIIWLLYGSNGLLEFNESVKMGFRDESPFYQVEQTNDITSARVHELVKAWMNYISKDPACRATTTAIGDLLRLVEDGLLVVKLPGSSGSVVKYDLGKTHTTQLEGNVSGDLPIRYSVRKWSWSQPRYPKTPMVNTMLLGSDRPIGPEVQSESAAEEPGRYRADELCDKLKLIELKNEKDSYWATQRELPLPDSTSYPFSISNSRGAGEGRTRPLSIYESPKFFRARPKVDVDRTSAARMDYDHPELHYDGQRMKDMENKEGDEPHFTTRARETGSKNKRKAEPTTKGTNTLPSQLSSSRPSKSKRPRNERHQDDDEGDQDDRNGLQQHSGRNAFPVTANWPAPSRNIYL